MLNTAPTYQGLEKITATARPAPALETWLHRHRAELNAINCLLNCYLREYALPAQQVDLDALPSDAPLHLRAEPGRHLVVRFTRGERLLMCANQVSLLSRCRFISAPYLKSPGHNWRRLGATELSYFLLQHLAAELTTEFNTELFEQIENSVRVSHAFLTRRAHKHPFDDGFLRAEQALAWGHALHPAPKSRHGVSMDDMLACSPEIYAAFPLYWFTVAPELIEQQGQCHWTPQQLFNQLHEKTDCLYPCHPWEVHNILRQPLVRAAIAEGLITPLGFLGRKIAPTSSVRTLYHPDLAAQLKFSIHVRLTNCVRKNAWYELEGAVALTHLLRPVQQSLRKQLPNFSCLLEPLASTLNLDTFATQRGLDGAQLCRESFGILYRENFTEQTRQQRSPAVAASVFTFNDVGASELVIALRRQAQARGLDYNAHALRWFNAYAQCLLPGVLHYFFKRGVIFEPHLQNVLIGFTDELPSHVWIRDLEGTKLLADHWPAATLSHLSPRARDAIYYSRAQGWQRIAYCTLVNNLSEAAFHCANGDTQLEQQLWQALANIVANWQQDAGPQPELTAFLAGEPLPSKSNFTTRLLQKADRRSGYVALTNPLAAPMEARP